MNTLDSSRVYSELNLLVGGHYSISKGLLGSMKEAEDDGVRTFQVFLGSPQAYFPSQFESADIRAFSMKARFMNVYAHTPFFINLLAEVDVKRKLSIKGLVQYLKLGQALGLKGVNTHVGSLTGRPMDIGYDLLKDSLVQVKEDLFSSDSIGAVKAVSGNDIPTLLLEIAVGAGSQVGDSLEFLDDICRDLSTPEFKIAICLDTAHAFGAGYDLCSEVEVDRIHEEHGDLIKLIHLNDAAKKFVTLGCKKDRHDTLGAGAIGLKAIEYFIKVFFEVPMILERSTKEGIQRDLMTLLFLQQGSISLDSEVWSEVDFLKAEKVKKNVGV